MFSVSRKNIANLYSEMYQLAEDIAIHEMKKFESRIRFNSIYRKAMLKGLYDDEEVIADKISKYRDERLKHHMDEMKEFLDKYLEIEKTRLSKRFNSYKKEILEKQK